MSASLFSWRSEMLQNYRPGLLVAVARDPDEARDMIRANYMAWVEKNRDWWLLDEDREELDTARQRLEADLAAEPATDGVLFISGSE